MKKLLFVLFLGFSFVVKSQKYSVTEISKYDRYTETLTTTIVDKTMFIIDNSIIIGNSSYTVLKVVNKEYYMLDEEDLRCTGYLKLINNNVYFITIYNNIILYYKLKKWNY